MPCVEWPRPPRTLRAAGLARPERYRCAFSTPDGLLRPLRLCMRDARIESMCTTPPGDRGVHARVERHTARGASGLVGDRQAQGKGGAAAVSAWCAAVCACTAARVGMRDSCAMASPHLHPELPHLSSPHEAMKGAAGTTTSSEAAGAEGGCDAVGACASDVAQLLVDRGVDRNHRLGP